MSNTEEMKAPILRIINIEFFAQKLALESY
ncbi:MAG: hypothetical protein ACJARX_000603 [Psychroserpens sp.]|jgi:hypothetical protein